MIRDFRVSAPINIHLHWIKNLEMTAISQDDENHSCKAKGNVRRVDMGEEMSYLGLRLDFPSERVFHFQRR